MHCKKLLRLNVVSAILKQEVNPHEGVMVTSGAFGVLKPNDINEEGGQVTCLIFNLVLSNCLQRSKKFDCRGLTPAFEWLKIVLAGSEVLLWSSNDLSSAFFLVKLPVAWKKLFALERPIWSTLRVTFHIGSI